MKKISVLCFSILIVLLFSACTSNGGNGTTDSSVVFQSSTFYDESSYNNIWEESSQNYDSDDSSEDEYSDEEESSEEESYEPEVSYIGNREIQYSKKDDMYNLMFSIMDQNKKPMKVSGIVDIRIEDDRKNVLYTKQIEFDESDYTSWTNRQRDTSTQGIWLDIPRSDVSGGTSSSGNVYFTVSNNVDYNFDESTLRITDLPSKEVVINLPQIPASFVDNRISSRVSYSTIHSLTYKTTTHYDGEATVEFTALVSLDSKSSEETTSSYVCIGYKLYDEDGIIVDSGNLMTNNLAVGEKTIDTFSIYNLDPMKTYTLKLLDSV